STTGSTCTRRGPVVGMVVGAGVASEAGVASVTGAAGLGEALGSRPAALDLAGRTRLHASRVTTSAAALREVGEGVEQAFMGTSLKEQSYRNGLGGCNRATGG